MSTTGRRYRKHASHMIRFNGEDHPLHALPRLISEHEQARGEPLTVTMPPTLSEAHQRLLATLGVVVRFDQSSTESQ